MSGPGCADWSTLGSIFDMALAARRAANGGAGGDGDGRAGGEFCYFVIHAVAWPAAELLAIPPGGERHPVGPDQSADVTLVDQTG